MPSAARKQTKSVPEPAAPGPILIRVTRQADGCVYTLDIHSRLALEREFPAGRFVPDVFIGTKTERDFEEIHKGKIWKQVTLLLTDLPETELRRRGVELRDALGQHPLGKVY